MKRHRERNKRFDRGRWAVQRERGRIADLKPVLEFDNTESIGSTINRLMGGMDMKSSSWIEELHSCWGGIVGDSVAKHARPGRIEGARLIVFVDNSVWLNELSRYWKSTIVSNLQKKFGSQRIQSITLRIDPD